jgi:protein HOOK3
MDHFNATAIARDLGTNWALKATNLKKLLRNLEDFYHEELRKDADFESLSTYINDIAKEEDQEHLLEFVELILVAVTSCEDKEIFVGRMMEMDPECLGELQEILQDAYKVITNFDEGDTEGDGDADSLVFEEKAGEDEPSTASSVLFPSHEDSSLMKEKDELLQALQDAKREIGHLKSQASIDAEDNRKEKDKLRALNDDLQQRLAIRDNELSSVEQAIKNTKRTLEEAQADVADLTEKNASLADELDVEKSKVLQLRKSEAMVEVYRKKLDELQSSNQQMGNIEDQTAKYVEQIMTLENENRKIPSLKKMLEESQIQTKKLESRIADVEFALGVKDNEINKLKDDVSNSEKAKKMYRDELNELRAYNEGAADAALSLNSFSDSNEKTVRMLENELSKLRAQKLEMQGGGLAELQKQLDEKEEEVAKLSLDKERLEMYTKKTLQKFQEKYLVALQDCKLKLKEKCDKIEALEMRSTNEKVAQKREEKLLLSALFELGIGVMSNRHGKR